MKEDINIKIKTHDFEELEELINSALELLVVKKYSASVQQLSKASSIIERINLENEETYSVSEVAFYLNVSTKTILRMLHDGRLKSIKKGKNHRIFESSVQEYKNSKKNTKTVSLETLKLLGIIKGE